MPFSLATAAVFDATQFARAVEHSAIGTALIGLDGAWLSVNGALRSFLGYSEDELTRLTFQDITWPDDLELDLDHLDAVLEGRIGSYQIEKRYVRKDGQIVWAELTVSLVRAANGEPLFFISHVQDIGVRKVAEIERTRLAERVTLATRGAGIGIWDWTLDTGRLVWSEEMFALFGWTSPHAGDAEVSLADFFDMVLAEDRPALQAAVTEAERSGVLDSEFRVGRSDGDIRYIKAFARVHRDADGRAIRLLGANWDVTAIRTAARQAEAASRAKSQFLAMMSHEIRTPMNGILGMTQVMLSGDIADEQRCRLGVIADCGEALVTILNDILDLSKVEAGKLEVEAAPFDLRHVLEGVHATYLAAADTKGIGLKLVVDEAVRGYVGDSTRVRQIAANLVSNAIKFTTSGDVAMIVRAMSDGVVLEVSDTGQGMDADTLSRIFRPFIQADASTTRRFGGTGLGLSIVHELVRIMGGEVLVESRPGEGSVFTVRLPLAQSNTMAAPVRRAGSSTERVQTLRLLVAEDNPVNQLVIQALLEPFGIAPVIVENGVEAVKTWQEGVWDAVLMDVHMPLMDGFQAVSEIRRLEALGGLSRTPIIALTADAMTHHRQQCLAQGMDDLVAKPIQIEALAAALRGVLPASERNRAA